jgi:hypothetical protein
MKIENSFSEFLFAFSYDKDYLNSLPRFCHMMIVLSRREIAAIMVAVLTLTHTLILLSKVIQKNNRVLLTSGADCSTTYYLPVSGKC